MYLVEVNFVGTIMSDSFLYELVFCNDKIKAKVRGKNLYKWGASPARGIPMKIINDDTLILKTCYFSVKEQLIMLKESGAYSLNEAFDSIIPLAWSNNIYKGERIVLKYGEDYNKIDGNLFSQNIELKKLINE
jgi:hypothetical protein